jgi:hypothetical protein
MPARGWRQFCRGLEREQRPGMTSTCRPRPAPRCALLLLLAVIGLSGCRRGPPLPQVTGPLADVVVRAAFGHDGAPGPAIQPLLIDTTSFMRLGFAVNGVPFTQEELLRQITRPVVLVDAADVLSCPERRPCRVVEDGVYVEVWEAERRGDTADIVVGRVFNVQGLYSATQSATHRLTVVRAGAGWRLTRLQRLPS